MCQNKPARIFKNILSVTKFNGIQTRQLWGCTKWGRKHRNGC